MNAAVRFGNLQEAVQAWMVDGPMFAERGLNVQDVVRYTPDPWKRNWKMACDALPTLSTDPNSAIPVLLTTSIDPEITRILFTPNQAAEIFGEKRAGDWLQDTRLFPVVEHTGEVSSYGDFNNNGRAGVNADWPTRQAYLFQIIKEYGERELERAGLAKLNWVSEIDQAAVTILGKFLNYIYFFGVQGLQNYGLLNDPNLTAALTPSTKAYGGTKWISGSFVQATANEIYGDIQAVYLQLINQTFGLIDAKTKMTLAMSPASEVALTQTNSFNVNVHDLLKKNFPNLEVKTAAQYGVSSTSNSQGIASGNFMQLIVDVIDGNDVGYCAYNEKMKAHPIIRDMSSFRQKVTAGGWGSIVRGPFALASMTGL